MLPFGFSTKSVVLLYFFLHGIVFSLLLLVRSNRQDRSPFWLSLLLLLCSLYISPFMFGYAGWYSIDNFREILFYLPLQQLLLLGPAVYFYTRSLLDPDHPIKNIEKLHFLPAGLYLIYSLIIFTGDYLVFDQIYFYADGQDKDFDSWYQISGFLSMMIYFGKSLQYYLNYKRNIYNELSYADEVVYRYLLHFLSAMLLLLILRTLFFLLNPEWGEFGRKFWYYLSFSLVTYFLSIQAYTHTIRQQSLLHFRYRINPEPSPPPSKDKDFSPTYSEPEKERLLQLVKKQELFRNPGLTLSDIAHESSMTSKQVSTIINQGFQMNFNDFINLHRIYAVLDAIQRKEHEEKTLLALAFDNGFNSKSTFNRAFKKQTGHTPNYFIKNEVLNLDLKRKW